MWKDYRRIKAGQVTNSRREGISGEGFLEKVILKEKQKLARQWDGKEFEAEDTKIKVKNDMGIMGNLLKPDNKMWGTVW